MAGTVRVTVRVARREHAGLIVVGRRGVGEARRLGFVRGGVSAHSDTPVLVVPRP